MQLKSFTFHIGALASFPKHLLKPPLTTSLLQHTTHLRGIWYRFFTQAQNKQESFKMTQAPTPTVMGAAI
jgi:hypothetical protein